MNKIKKLKLKNIKKMQLKTNIFHFIFFIHLISFCNLTHLRRIWETEVPIENIKDKIEERKYDDIDDEIDSIESHCENSDEKYFIYLVYDLNYDASSIMDKKNSDNAVSLDILI